MDSKIYIIHASSDTDWVKLLIEYLRASSTQSLNLESSSLSASATNIETIEPRELRPDLFMVDRIIAKVSSAALSDPDFYFQLGSAWALNESVIAVVDSQLLDEDLPESLSRITRLTSNGPQSIVDLARRVIPKYVETESGAAALARLCGLGVDSAQNTAYELNQEKHKESDTLQGLPAVLPNAALFDKDEADRYPFFLEALEAGLAFSDCLFNRDEIDDFCSELDGSFGAFLNLLGGNWANLRRLNDIDLWLGAIDNLLETLPLERQNITNWYAVGSHLSTLLNIAGRDLFSDVDHRDSVQARWENTVDAFRFAASAADIPEEDLDRIQSLLENLIGPESGRDYSNMAEARGLIRELAAAAK